MTTQPPSLEDLLRGRLHELDEVQPPEVGFELQVIRAGRQRLQRRRSRVQGLVAVAAVAAIGVFVVPSVLRGGLGTRSGGSSAVAGATAAAPDQERAQAPAPDTSGGPQAAAGAGNGSPESGLAGSSGSQASDSVGQEVRIALVSLRAQLAKAYPDTFTDLTFDETTTPRRVVLRMTEDTPRAQRTVRDAIPAGIDVVQVVSPRATP